MHLTSADIERLSPEPFFTEKEARRLNSGKLLSVKRLLAMALSKKLTDGPQQLAPGTKSMQFQSSIVRAMPKDFLGAMGTPLRQFCGSEAHERLQAEVRELCNHQMATMTYVIVDGVRGELDVLDSTSQVSGLGDEDIQVKEVQ